MAVRTLSARQYWQYARCASALTSGEQVIPIGSWRNVATISIDEDFKITINGLYGTINGNAQYL